MNSGLTHVRNGVRIAHVEFLRSVRSTTGNLVRLLAFAFTALLFVGGPTVGGAYVALHFGSTVLEFISIETIRAGLAFLWLVPTILIAQRAVGKTGRIDHADGLLTITPAIEVVVGLLLAEYTRLLSLILVPIVVIAASLAYGLGAPTAFVTIVVAMLALFTTSLLVGHLLGVLFKSLLDGSELLTRYKSVLAVLAFVAYLVALSADGFDQLFATLLGVSGMLPMGWFGDLLTVGLPGVSASPTRVAGALILFALGVPILFVLDVHASTRLWYTDRTRPAVHQRSSTTGPDIPFLSSVLAGPTGAVSASIWRRTARGPLRLIYVIYPLLLLFAPLRDAVTTGEVPASLPVLLALYGTWAIGAATLNPFGDEGAMLPVTVTSTIRGRQFVRGHVLAVTLVGLPVLIVVTAVTGYLSPLKPGVWLPLTAASGYLALAGPLVAFAVGTAFPRFSEIRVTRSRRAVVPSKTAFVYYTLILGVGFLGVVIALVPGAASVLSNVLVFWSSILGHPIVIDPTTLRLAGGVVGGLIGVGLPPLAYRYAVRQFETYTLV